MVRSFAFLFVFLLCEMLSGQTNAKNLYPVRKESLWGLIDENGKQIEPCKYLQFSKGYDENYATCIKLWDGNRITFYRENEKKAIWPDGVTEFKKLNDDRYAMIKNGKFFLSDPAGKTITNRAFDYIRKSQIPNIFEFNVNGENGLMNRDGNSIIRLKLVPVFYCNSQYFYTRNKSGIQIYNRFGNPIASDSFVSVSPAGFGSSNFIGYYKSGVGRMMDSTGNTYFKFPKGYQFRMLGENFLYVFGKGKDRIYDLQQNNFLAMTPNFVRESPNPEYLIFDYEKYSILYSRNMDSVNMPKYKSVNGIGNGMVVQNMEGRYGYLDSSMQLKIPMEYESISLLEERFLQLKKPAALFGVYNLTYNQIETPFQYTHFIMGADYLKAYNGNTLDVYDIENNSLVNKMSFSGVVSKAVSQRNNPWDATSVRNTTNRRNIRAGSLQWRYTENKQGKKVMLLSLDSLGFVQDTMVPAYFDSVAITTSSFSAVMKKTLIPLKPNKSGKISYREIQQFYLLRHSDYSVLDSALDYISGNDLRNNFATIRVIKSNGKYCLVQRDSFRLTEEFDYITAFKSGARRAVLGNWSNNREDYNLFEGISNKYRGSISGAWYILNASGNVMPIEGLDGKGASYLSEFYLGQSVGSGVWAFVTDTLGKMVFPGNFQSIQQITTTGNTPLYLCLNKTTGTFLFHPDASLNKTARCETARKFGDHIQIQANNKMYLLQSPRPDDAVIIHGRVLPIHFNRTFIKEKKFWIPTDGNLLPVADKKFESVFPFNSTRTIAKANGKWGIIDTSISWIKAPTLGGNCGPVFYSSFIQQQNEHAVFIGLDGVKIPLPGDKFFAIEELSPGYFLYQKMKDYFIADRSGKTVISYLQEQPEKIFPYAVLKMKGESVMMDLRNGRLTKLESTTDIRDIKEHKYMARELHSNRLAFSAIQKEISHSETDIQPVLWKGGEVSRKEHLSLHQMGFVPVKSGDAFSLNFMDGSKSALPILQTITYADSEYILVRNLKGKSGIISKKGMWMLPPVYSSVQKLPFDLFSIEQSENLKFYFGDGSPIPGDWKNYELSDELVFLYNGPEMAVYNLNQRKIIWSTNPITE